MPFEFGPITAKDWELIGRGALTTLVLVLGTYSMGLVLASFGAATRTFHALRFIRPIFRGYIEIFRSTPLLVQLILVFFGLPLLVGTNVSAATAAVVTMSLYAGAYLSEIVWGGLSSVPRTQWEAGLSMGLKRRHLLRFFIVPQAIRVILPAAVGFAVVLVKNSALVSVLGFVDLTRAGRQAIEVTFEPFIIWLAVAAIYFVLCYPLSVFGQRLELKVRAR